MVNVGEVNYLEGEWLLVEVVWLAKGDIELDVPEGHNFLPRHDLIEWCLDGVQVAMGMPILSMVLAQSMLRPLPLSISTLVRHMVPR